MKTKIYSASETAFILRHHLGPMRAWSDFLSDCIRLKTHLDSHILLPISSVDDGRAKRPVYAVEDIAVFVSQVWRSYPDAKEYVPPKGKLIDIDPSGKYELYVKSLTPHPISPRAH